MGRQMLPQNRATQDRVEAFLRSRGEAAVTVMEVVEAIGGMRTVWDTCPMPKYRCRATYMGDRNAQHYEPQQGNRAMDSWEYPLNAGDVQPMLARLERDGLARKIGLAGRVLWVWCGPEGIDMDAFEDALAEG